MPSPTSKLSENAIPSLDPETDGSGMSTVGEVRIPESHQRSLRRAIELLKGFGCTEVHLFGSLANGRARQESDIDLAVRGCPKKDFFHVLGRLMKELDRSVDLVDLDCKDPFAHYLEKEGELLRIA